ncbi:Protein O-mannosyltransferase 2 [Dipsacomyces acuminosporus]|nr:Protein O-mannosyltransferase 2 [Dipsacomyces acuminosporus]
MHGVGRDRRVVWDETHEGRFANNYISKRFYLDVHPALGKLLITFALQLFGYNDASFSFDSGKEYREGVPYIQMRQMQCLIGALLTNYSPQADLMGSDYSVKMNGSALQLQPEFLDHESFAVLRSSSYPYEYLSATSNSVDGTASDSKGTVISTTRKFLINDYFGFKRLASNAKTDPGRSRIGDGDLIAIQIPKTSSYVAVIDGYLPDQNGLFVHYKQALDSSDYTDTNADALWSVAVVSASSSHSKHDRLVRPIATKFKLQSSSRNCELAIDYHHPLTQINHPNFKDGYFLSCSNAGTIWHIEHQLSSDAPNVNISRTVQTHFIKDVLALNRLMLEVNSMLISDPDKYSSVESRPWSWPFLTKPMKMVAWDGDSVKYMLIGSPLLWFASAIVCIFIHPLVAFMSAMIHQRSHGRVATLRQSSAVHFLWYAWLVNYIPFFLLARVTYLHHYLPSLYFGLLLLAVYVHQAIACVSKMVHLQMLAAQRMRLEYLLATGAACLALASYYFVYPLTFGLTDPCSYSQYRMFPSWGVCIQHA